MGLNRETIAKIAAWGYHGTSPPGPLSTSWRGGAVREIIAKRVGGLRPDCTSGRGRIFVNR